MSVSLSRLATATGLITLSACATAASNVSIYGRVDTSIASTKTGQQRTHGMQSSGSYWGLQGREDLGPNLTVGFILESGFRSDTGSQTDAKHFFNEYSELFVESEFGTLRLGRFSNPSYLAIADRASFHNEDYGITADKLYVYQGNGSNRVAYASPEWSGFSADASVSLHERAQGDGSDKNSYDLAANYDLGDWSFGVGYGKQGNNQQYALRASWTHDAWTAAGYRQHAHQDGQRINVTRIAVGYAIGASEIHANFGRATGANSATAKQWTLGYNYHLSQRTKVYAFYTQLHNKRGASFGNDLNLSANEGTQSVSVGIRHLF